MGECNAHSKVCWIKALYKCTIYYLPQDLQLTMGTLHSSTQKLDTGIEQNIWGARICEAAPVYFQGGGRGGAVLPQPQHDRAGDRHCGHGHQVGGHGQCEG